MAYNFPHNIAPTHQNWNYQTIQVNSLKSLYGEQELYQKMKLK